MRPFVFFFSSILLLTDGASGQTLLADQSSTQYFPKMVLRERENLVITSDTLMLDTLIMRQASRLTFMSKHTMLVVAHAFIGMGSTLDASGVNGEDGDFYTRHGDHGTDGRNLTISIRLEELGTLDVVANGGNGGRGGNSNEGGNGGVGGHGGDISFYYLSPHFAVAIMEQREKSVHFSNIGGWGGSGGRGGVIAQAIRQPNGAGTRPIVGSDMRGQNGTAGRNGKTGVLKFLKTSE